MVYTQRNTALPLKMVKIVLELELTMLNQVSEYWDNFWDISLMYVFQMTKASKLIRSNETISYAQYKLWW